MADRHRRLFPNDTRVSTRSFEKALKLSCSRSVPPAVARPTKRRAFARAVEANRGAYDEWLSRRVRRPSGG